MDEYLNEMNKMMKESTKSIQYINKGMEKELNNMYNYGTAAIILDVAIFIAMVYFIFRNHTRTNELERENKFLNHRLNNIEEYLRNKGDYREQQVNPFFD